MLEPLVRLSDAACEYRRGSTTTVALRSASCSVVAGDRIAVVGPSGSGKSTLLYLMGGLEEPTAGTVSWPALEGTRLRPNAIAFSFQSPSLLPSLTAVENVELPLLLERRAALVARAAAMDALESVGLLHTADRLPEELSIGQAQSVAVARALCTRPALILADEPTGQLDQASATRLIDALLAAVAKMGTALVVATHDLALAARLSTTWQLDHGILKIA